MVRYMIGRLGCTLGLHRHRANHGVVSSRHIEGACQYCGTSMWRDRRGERRWRVGMPG